MVMFHRGCIENCKTNDQLAHIAAHEISHLVLKHPKALTSSMSFRQEYEADNLGLMMMARAGYDPIGAIEWLEREVRLDKYRHKRYSHKSESKGFETHPPVSFLFEFCWYLYLRKLIFQSTKIESTHSDSSLHKRIVSGQSGRHSGPN